MELNYDTLRIIVLGHKVLWIIGLFLRDIFAACCQNIVFSLANAMSTDRRSHHGHVTTAHVRQVLRYFTVLSTAQLK